MLAIGPGQHTRTQRYLAGVIRLKADSEGVRRKCQDRTLGDQASTASSIRARDADGGPAVSMSYPPSISRALRRRWEVRKRQDSDICANSSPVRAVGRTGEPGGRRQA